ncbi:orcokinin peptides type B-like [Argonauta hians]
MKMESMFRVGFVVLLNLCLLTRAEQPTKTLLSREQDTADLHKRSIVEPQDNDFGSRSESVYSQKRKFDSISDEGFGSMGKRKFDAMKDFDARDHFNMEDKRQRFDSISYEDTFSDMGKRESSDGLNTGTGESRLFKRNFDRISGSEGLAPGFPRTLRSHKNRPYHLYPKYYKKYVKSPSF